MVDRFERFSLAISEINRYWHRLTTQEMEPYGLKGAHCMYLLALARHPEGITAPRLCEACDKDKADVELDYMNLLILLQVLIDLYLEVVK